MAQNNDAKQDSEKGFLLEVKNVSKHFEIGSGLLKGSKQYLKAVNDISFTVNSDETLGIVGESGSGKSTLASLIMALHSPTEGSINFDGVNLNEISRSVLRKKRADIQMVFQDPYSSLNPRMKVFDIIAEPLKTHGIASGKELTKRVYQLLEDVGLDASHANRFPHEFSGGQRQRIGIARALSLRPKLVICDEPVSALDVSVQAQILNLLKQLQREYGLTYIFIAHGLPSVKYVSDRIAVMYLGKIVELTTKEKLFTSPKHPYTEGLLNSIPISNPNIRDTKNFKMLEGDIPSPINPPSGCSFRTRCPYAQEKCALETPEFVENEQGHYVACHFPINNNEDNKV